MSSKPIPPFRPLPRSYVEEFLSNGGAQWVVDLWEQDGLIEGADQARATVSLREHLDEYIAEGEDEVQRIYDALHPPMPEPRRPWWRRWVR